MVRRAFFLRGVSSDDAGWLASMKASAAVPAASGGVGAWAGVVETDMGSNNSARNGLFCGGNGGEWEATGVLATGSGRAAAAKGEDSWFVPGTAIVGPAMDGECCAAACCACAVGRTSWSEEGGRVGHLGGSQCCVDCGRSSTLA